MKKIFIIFLSMIVLSLSLVLPSFAVMTDSFGSYTNLFDPSDVVQARFYTDLDNYQVNNFYSVNLKSNTDYTFISTNGSRSFYSGQLVYDDSSNSSVYSFDSWNLVDPSLFADGYVCTYDPVTDTISMTRRNGGNRFSQTAYVNLPYDTYRISIVYSGSASYLDFLINGNSKITFLNPDVYPSSNTFTYTGSISSLQFYLDNGFAEGTTANAIKFYIRPSSESRSYIDFYSDPTFLNFETSISYFNTGDVKNNTTFLIGINDILSGSTSNLFSSNQSSENEFYLIEGKLTVDQISDILDGNNYQNGYNSGYDQGYKEGEFDGLNSTKFMNSTLLTAISAPFVIVSSALNFDLFGINFYYIIQVIFTLLLIAFVVTQLKGRE